MNKNLNLTTAILGVFPYSRASVFRSFLAIFLPEIMIARDVYKVVYMPLSNHSEDKSVTDLNSGARGKPHIWNL